MEVKTCYNCMQEGHVRFQCRNPPACRACNKPGHKAGDEACDHYQLNESLPFLGKGDLFSNFYECNIEWEGKNVNTSEKAYGYEEAMANDCVGLTNDILRAKTGYDVKQIMKKIHKKPGWKGKDVEVMTKIAIEKVKQVPEVKEALLNSGDRVIVEAVPRDLYWSCGLDKEAAAKTDPNFWPGENQMGKIYMHIREVLRSEMEENEYVMVKSRNQHKEPTPP